MYEWDSLLETGNTEIDEQHKEWVAHLNRLIVALREGKGKEEIIKTMDFLILYTVKHFAAEENLMLSHDYEDYYVHKRYHDEFKKTARGLIQQLVREGPSEKLVDSTISTIKNWLIHHIKSDDFRMAACLNNRKARHAPAL